MSTRRFNLKIQVFLIINRHYLFKNLDTKNNNSYLNKTMMKIFFKKINN